MTNDIFNALEAAFYNFFGKSKETTTHAELDALMQNAGTLEQIQANAKNDALLAVQAKIDDIEGRLTAYETTVAERDQTIATLNADIEAKDAEIATLAASNTANETLIAANKAKITQLAGEVSALKAGKPTQNDEGGGDANYQVVTTQGNTVQVAVKATSVNDRLGFTQNN